MIAYQAAKPVHSVLCLLGLVARKAYLILSHIPVLKKLSPATDSTVYSAKVHAVKLSLTLAADCHTAACSHSPSSSTL